MDNLKLILFFQMNEKFINVKEKQEEQNRKDKYKIMTR